MGLMLLGLLGRTLVAGEAAGADQSVGVSTDVAGLFINHPEAIKHRETSPDEWVYDDFACNAEFTAGTFIAFSTGEDDLSMFNGMLPEATLTNR